MKCDCVQEKKKDDISKLPVMKHTSICLFCQTFSYRIYCCDNPLKSSCPLAVPKEQKSRSTESKSLMKHAKTRKYCRWGFDGLNYYAHKDEFNIRRHSFSCICLYITCFPIYICAFLCAYVNA